MVEIAHFARRLAARVLRWARRPWSSPRPRRTEIGILPAYAALARYSITTIDLEPRLEMLVTQLAAERSGCRWCIERGRHLWREAGLPLDLLVSLRHYETSALFSDRERAALRFTDAVTRYDEDGISDARLAAARRHLSEPEIAAVTGAVAATHFFNPITGILGGGVDDDGPAPRRAPWGATIGSSLRNLWL